MGNKYIQRAQNSNKSSGFGSSLIPLSKPEKNLLKTFISHVLMQHFTAPNHTKSPPAASPEPRKGTAGEQGQEQDSWSSDTQHRLNVNVERQRACHSGRRRRRKHKKSEQPRFC